MAPTNASVTRNVNCLVCSTGWVEVVWVWEIFLGIISLSSMFFGMFLGMVLAHHITATRWQQKQFPATDAQKVVSVWSFFQLRASQTYIWWLIVYLIIKIFHASCCRDFPYYIYTYIYVLYRNNIINYDIITSTSFVSLQHFFVLTWDLCVRESSQRWCSLILEDSRTGGRFTASNLLGVTLLFDGSGDD